LLVLEAEEFPSPLHARSLFSGCTEV